MNVSYATMEAMGMLVKRLGQDARRLEKALAETMNASAEWKRIAEEMKKERNAEREALGIQAAKEAGKALGMVEGEGLRAAAQRVVKERDALRTKCDDLRRVFSLVHGSLGIQQGEHIGNAIDALKKERDELATRLRQSIARGDFAEMRLATLAAELETERERHRQTAAVPQSVDAPRAHPVKVGEYVKNDNGDVCQVHEVYAEYLLNTGWTWAFENCTPCDPPTASHDTPAGKETAQAAAEPKPGDTVRLVRVPTQDDYPAENGWLVDWGRVGEEATVLHVTTNKNNQLVAQVNHGGYEWPISCIEIVEDAK